MTVTYPYWSKVKQNGNLKDPDRVGSVSAEFVSGTRTTSTWQARIPADSGSLFQHGKEIKATVSLTRSSDGKNTSAESSPRQVSAC